MHDTGTGSVDGGDRLLADAPLREMESLARLESPFASESLWVQEQPDPAAFVPEVASPFTEGFTVDSETATELEMMEMLLGELEDEEFVEGLEALELEASARAMLSGLSFDGESGVPVIDASGVEAWVDGIGERADQLLAELEARFRDRPVETVSEEELDAATGTYGTQDENPLDAQELFFGALKKKLKKIAGAAKRIVKKGTRFATKFLPLGMIFKRLRPIIKPLLRRVLRKAIGKLPRGLQAPARALARRFGLATEAEADGPESETSELAAEFDASVAEALLAPDDASAKTLEMELLAQEQAEDGDASASEQLDRARERLTQELLAAEPRVAPTEAMEQFLPMAILPIVRTGIRIIGRKRVVNFVADLLAKLIRPVVGSQLAKPLAVQIADKGLGLLNLENEAASGRLGAEAVVAATEDVIGEVFSMPEETLEDELLLESVVQEAFHRAAARHFPAEMLRADGPDVGGSGVWVMMPRATSPVYRYRKYSQRIPVVVTRAMARDVVFSDGETLEERLIDDGETRWPVDVEMEAYELLPGASVGHLVPFETGEGEAPLDSAAEFDSLAEAGELPLPPQMRHRAWHGRGRGRQLVRIKARGRALRKQSRVSVRLDLTGAQPSIRVHLFLGELRAMVIAQHLKKQEMRAVVDTFRSLTGTAVRRVVARRLSIILKRRKIVRDAAAVQALSDQLFNGFQVGLASKLPSLTGSLSAAARDRAAGITVTAAFPFESRGALATGSPGKPTLTVRPGQQRD